MSRMSPCPDGADQLAESYCLGKLTPEASESFEEHFLACPVCVQRVEQHQDFLDALRAWERDRNGAASDRDRLKR